MFWVHLKWKKLPIPAWNGLLQVSRLKMPPSSVLNKIRQYVLPWTNQLDMFHSHSRKDERCYSGLWVCHVVRMGKASKETESRIRYSLEQDIWYWACSMSAPLCWRDKVGLDGARIDGEVSMATPLRGATAVELCCKGAKEESLPQNPQKQWIESSTRSRLCWNWCCSYHTPFVNQWNTRVNWLCVVPFCRCKGLKLARCLKLWPSKQLRNKI